MRSAGADTLADDLSPQLGLDLNTLDPQAPLAVEAVTAPAAINGPQSWYRQIHADVVAGTTFQALVEKYSWIGRSGHLQVVGTPETVADVVEEWFTQRGSDGFVIQGTTVPGSTDAFMEQVVPILQQRGLFRREYEGSTLREHLGLPRPVNRHESVPIRSVGCPPSRASSNPDPNPPSRRRPPHDLLHPYHR